MRKVLTTGSFLVFSLLGLYYVLTFFSLLGLYYVLTFFGVLSDVSISESHPEQLSSGVGIADAQTDRMSQKYYPVEDFAADRTYKVIRVVDGDTVKIDYNGKATNVRLIGVDTPETVHPNKPVEAYGKEASNFTKNLLLGESVYLRYDVDRRDKYGRLLAYLYRAPDGLFVNLEIVRQGYGHAYTQFPFKHMELFRYYGNRARTAGKGLYGTPQAGVGETNSKAIGEETEGEVYLTRTGEKYHREGCRSLSRSKIPISLAEAKQKYAPCGRCNPPR